MSWSYRPPMIMSSYLLQDWKRDRPLFVPYGIYKILMELNGNGRGSGNGRGNGRGSGPTLGDFIWAGGLRGKGGVAALARDWVRRRKDADSLLAQRRDDIVDFCAEAPTLASAIARACASLRRDGRLHNHQSRVPAQVRDDYRVFLWRRFRRDMHMAMEAHDLEDVEMLLTDNLWTWENVWRYCERGRDIVTGVGPVMAYDVATRIGAYLRVQPSAVYLKAGTLAGTRALADLPGLPRSAVSLHSDVWVPVKWYEARGMRDIARYGVRSGLGAADALEDALCTLRECFVALREENE